MITFPAYRSPSLRMLRNFVRKHDGGRRETKTAPSVGGGRLSDSWRKDSDRKRDALRRPSICAAVRPCSMWRPAPATRRLLPCVDGARWRRSITFPACSRSGVFGPPPKESRWRFSKVMPRRLAFPTTRSMSCCRPLARCLPPTTRKRPTSSYGCAALEGKSGWQNWRPTGFGGAFFWCRKATGSPSTRAETSEPLGYGRSFAAAFWRPRHLRGQAPALRLPLSFTGPLDRSIFDHIRSSYEGIGST